MDTTNVETETLKLLTIFCGAGLLVSLLVASYGVDLGEGIFWPLRKAAAGLDQRP